LLSVLIPDIPAGVRTQIQRENLLAREVLFDAELDGDKSKKKANNNYDRGGETQPQPGAEDLYGVESDELIQSKNGSLRNRNNAPNNDQPLDSLDEVLGTVTA